MGTISQKLKPSIQTEPQLTSFMHYLHCSCGVNDDMWDDTAEFQWLWHHHTAAAGPPRSCVRSPYSQFALQHRPGAVSAAQMLEWTEEGMAERRGGGGRWTSGLVTHRPHWHTPQHGQTSWDVGAGGGRWAATPDGQPTSDTGEATGSGDG